MASIRSHAVLDHDAATVWDLVRDIASVADWFPAMSSSDRTDVGRRVTLSDGSVLLEDTVTLDDSLRRYQYRVAGGDIAVRSHLGTVDVLELGDGRSALVYGSDVEPIEVAEAFDAAVSEAVANVGLHLTAAAHADEQGPAKAP